MAVQNLRSGLEANDYGDMMAEFNRAGGLPGASTMEEDRAFLRGMANYLEIDARDITWSFCPLRSFWNLCQEPPGKHSPPGEG
jgi:hypothetical protein